MRSRRTPWLTQSGGPTTSASRPTPSTNRRPSRSSTTQSKSSRRAIGSCSAPVQSQVNQAHETRGLAGRAALTLIESQAEDRDSQLLPAAVDQLDSVAVRIAHEADERPAFAHAVRLAFGLDALPLQLFERLLHVVDRQRDVAVAGAVVVVA